jgi:hypothetical protein
MADIHKRSKLRLSVVSRVLLVFSAVCLAASASIVYSFGDQLYFALFHRPPHAIFTKPVATYKPAQLPHFNVVLSPVADRIDAGASQTVSLQVTSDRDVDANILVWVKSPANKQVFRSPSGKAGHFIRGVPQNVSYTVTSAPTMPRGTYQISVIISSADRQADYYVNYGAAEYILL